jgi:hypothetical protein
MYQGKDNKELFPIGVDAESTAVEIQSAFQEFTIAHDSSKSNGETCKVTSANLAEFHATIRISTILHRDYNQGEASTCFIDEKSILTSNRHVPDARPVCCIHGH